MQTEQISPNAIYEMALKVCSAAELREMPRASLLSLAHLLKKRMLREPPPTLDELQGIKELVLDHLSHPDET